MKKSALRTLFLALLSFGVCLTLSAAPPRYEITDLRELPRVSGHSEIVGAFAVNDKGQVVGGAEEAWLWEKGKRTKLGALAPEPYEEEFGTRSVAYGVNAYGQIVGASGSYSHLFMGYNYFARAIRFDGDFLTTLSDSNTRFEAYGINNRGQIVGQGNYRAFYFEKSKLTMLGTLSKAPQGNFSVARGINNRGQVVGSTTVGTVNPVPNHHFLPVHAFLWQQKARRMHDLGVLPGYTAGAAEAVNDRGQIAGSCEREEKNGFSYDRATLWADGKIVALPTLPGSRTSEALGINAPGQSVGYCSPVLETPSFGPDTRSGFRATLWQNGQVYDLNSCVPVSSGWTLERACAINTQGWIVGDGVWNGKPYAFLLTPMAGSR